MGRPARGGRKFEANRAKTGCLVSFSRVRFGDKKLRVLRWRVASANRMR